MSLEQYEYYRTPNGVLYCADSLEILPMLPKVDLVLTDPPYGMNFKSNYRNVAHANQTTIPNQIHPRSRPQPPIRGPHGRNQGAVRRGYDHRERADPGGSQGAEIPLVDDKIA